MKEYDIPADKPTLNLVIKPGAAPAQAQAMSSGVPTEPAPSHTRAAPSLGIIPPPPEEQPSPSLIPQVILSPTPVQARDGSRSPHSRTQSLTPISLDVDQLSATDPPHHASTTTTSYQSTITSPDFWKGLHAFLGSQFKTREDANSAFEEFLLSSKNELTSHEIAKIRDYVGVLGMGGT